MIVFLISFLIIALVCSICVIIGLVAEEKPELVIELPESEQSKKKVNFCFDCKFNESEIYPTCKNQGVLNKTYDYFNRTSYIMKKAERKTTALNILVRGYASCDDCRLVVGSNCSHFVTKEKENIDND